MKIEVNENSEIEFREVFNGITLVTNEGERINICMRDSGFEFEYEGEKYFAKEGYVEPFKKSIRGNYLVDQYHTEVIDVVNNN